MKTKSTAKPAATRAAKLAGKPRVATRAGRPARPARSQAPASVVPRPASAPAPKPAPVPKPAPAPRSEDFSVASCDCDLCRAACRNAPGWFTPEQIPRLAKHLGLSIEDTFRRYLALGVTHLDDGSQRAGVMPHKLRDGKKPGSRWTLAEIATPGRCVFFDRGRCTIYPVRPDECARMMHDRGDRTRRIRLRIVARWTEAALAPFLALAAGTAVRRRGRP
ncbi:MAG: YkgJ family cysteine cluster protein [bacterium]|nr:YkgJ family cysteine cluster protein [bacterium]